MKQKTVAGTVLKQFDYPTKLDDIFIKLYHHNIIPIIVGGFVRDTILGLVSKDIDIELYGVKSLELLEPILKEFGTLNLVGKSFGVLKLKFDDIEIDLSLPRLDIKKSDGHRGFTVEVKENLDFKIASFRRDFTINAMGYNPKNKELLDPYHGVYDLEHKILREVDSTTFIQDPLRVLRAIQFSARFDFRLSNTLFLLSKDMIERDMLSQLSKERIFEELKKLLLKSKRASIGIKLLRVLKIYKFFKEIKDIDRYAYKKTLISIDMVKEDDLTLNLAVLLYRFDTTNIVSLLNRLTNQQKLINDIIKLKESNISLNASDYELYKLATKIEISKFLNFKKIVDFNNKKQYNQLYSRASKLNILTQKLPPLIKGSDLIKMGLTPSAEFNKILAECYDTQMRGINPLKSNQFTSFKS